MSDNLEIFIIAIYKEIQKENKQTKNRVNKKTQNILPQCIGQETNYKYIPQILQNKLVFKLALTIAYIILFTKWSSNCSQSILDPVKKT